MFGIVSNIVQMILGSVYGITASVVSSVINTLVTGVLTVKGSGTYFLVKNASSIDFSVADTGLALVRVELDLVDGDTNLTSAGLQLRPTARIRYRSGSFGAEDASLVRVAAGVLAPGSGTTGIAAGWMQNWAGEAALANAYTNATAAFTNTNLSVTVIAGRSYRIQACLQVSDSTTTDGGQIDFNGGAASATTFFVSASAVGSVTAGVVAATALATAITYTVITGTDYIWLNGYLKVNAGGTLILRGAQVTHTTGTLTIGAGSWLALYDTVPL